MKRKTILSFAAATVICAASAGSYAAWDNVTATSNGTITVASRIDVKTQQMSFSETHDLLQAPFYDANATFDLSSVDASLHTNLNFELSVSVKNNGSEVSANAYTVTIVPSGGSAISESAGKYVDTAPVFTANGAVYGVKVTLKDTLEGTALAGASLSVDVVGTLVKK